MKGVDTIEILQIKVDDSLVCAAKRILSIEDIDYEIYKDALSILDKIVRQISNQFQVSESKFLKELEKKYEGKSEYFKLVQMNKEFDLFQKNTIRDSVADEIIEKLNHLIDNYRKK